MASTLLALGVILVLVWRSTALLLSPELDLLRFALATMGLLFLVCGLVTRASVRSRAAEVFALYTLCQALHWGGQLPLEDTSSKLAADLFYVVVAVVVAQCLFVLMACELPGRMAWVRDLRVWLLGIPVALGVAIAAATWAEVAGARTALIGLYGFASYGLGLVGLLVIAWYARRTRGGLALLGSLAIPAAVGLAAGAAGYENEWLNLLYAGEPVAYAYAIWQADA